MVYLSMLICGGKNLRKKSTPTKLTPHAHHIMKAKPFRFIFTACLTAALFIALPVTGQVQKVETTTIIPMAEGTLTDFGPQGVVIQSEAGGQPLRYSARETTLYINEAGNPVQITELKPGLPVQVFYTNVDGQFIATKVLVRRRQTGSVALPAGAVGQTVVTTTQGVVQTPAMVPQAPRTEVLEVQVPAGVSLAPPRDRLASNVTTTTTYGTVTGFGPKNLLVQAEDSAVSFPYFVTDKTTYVNEAGRSLLADTIRKGDSVIVYHTREGDILVAARVILKTPAATTTTVITTPPAVIVPPAGTPESVVIEKKTTTTVKEVK